MKGLSYVGRADYLAQKVDTGNVAVVAKAVTEDGGYFAHPLVLAYLMHYLSVEKQGQLLRELERVYRKDL